MPKVSKKQQAARDRWAILKHKKTPAGASQSEQHQLPDCLENEENQFDRERNEFDDTQQPEDQQLPECPTTEQYQFDQRFSECGTLDNLRSNDDLEEGTFFRQLEMVGNFMHRVPSIEDIRTIPCIDIDVTLDAIRDSPLVGSYSPPEPEEQQFCASYEVVPEHFSLSDEFEGLYDLFSERKASKFW